MEKRKYLISLIVAFVLISCDKIDDPIPKDSGTAVDFGDTEFIIDQSLNIADTSELRALIESNTWVEKVSPVNDKRFIVLEEFTGMKCIFCPEGTKEIVRLDSIYQEQLIPVGIHAGTFALPNVAGDKYRSDYRVLPHANDYLNTFHKGSGYPSGIVSRIGGIVEGKDNWENSIKAIENDVPVARIDITNFYSEAAGILRVNIELEWLQTLAGSFNLQTYVVEDNIIDWQKFPSSVVPNEIPDYNHRHVLRKVVNDDTFGKNLNPAENGETQTIQFIFPIPSEWNADNVETVSFIFNNDVSSYEVIQANAAKIK
jgi:hypothetical protein